MSRVIKFRAWDPIRDEMYQGYDCFNPVPQGYVELQVMQFTGLTDKNGVDIYEGDIVSQEKNCMYSAGRNNKKVRFELDQFLSGDCSLYGAVTSFDAEVIGNIHQNKELLK